MFLQHFSIYLPCEDPIINILLCGYSVDDVHDVSHCWDHKCIFGRRKVFEYVLLIHRQWKHHGLVLSEFCSVLISNRQDLKRGTVVSAVLSAGFTRLHVYSKVSRSCENCTVICSFDDSAFNQWNERAFVLIKWSGSISLKGIFAYFYKALSSCNKWWTLSAKIRQSKLHLSCQLDYCVSWCHASKT